MEDTTIPSDSNGVYSLPSGYLAVTGETIQASQHNPPLEDLASAMSARLMRSGVSPMTGVLKIVDGSVGSPGVQFASAPSTGVYKTVNGLGVSVGGTKVAEFGPGGVISGARWIGELVPFTGLISAPALTVLPYGQTLSRTTYPDLWAFAQAEIAAGNTFYNNGNGSTTFGIGDLRGRVVAGLDNIGGTSANRLVNGSMAGARHTMGGAGGADTNTLTQAQIPSHNHTATDSGHTHAQDVNTLTHAGTPIIVVQGSTPFGIGVGGTTQSGTANISVGNTGGGGAHDNLQPMILCNFVLFAGA